MMILDNLFNWFSENANWFFSGLGVTIIVTIFSMLYKLYSKPKNEKSETTISAIYLNKQFPELKFIEKLQGFCRILLDDLNKIDRETNWSSEYFTPLDAEVEVHSENKKTNKIMDFLSAIKSQRKKRVFLVLGDLGSGKSVSLRSLCRELLRKKIDNKYKVPIYIVPERKI